MNLVAILSPLRAPSDQPQEAALPPRLSDWVRAAETSMTTPTEVAFALVVDGRTVWGVEVNETGALVYQGESLVEGCQTPAELTVALDRLAEEASR